jgi:hypothetical protein
MTDDKDELWQGIEYLAYAIDSEHLDVELKNLRAADKWLREWGQAHPAVLDTNSPQFDFAIYAVSHLIRTLVDNAEPGNRVNPHPTEVIERLWDRWPGRGTA